MKYDRANVTRKWASDRHLINRPTNTTGPNHKFIVCPPEHELLGDIDRACPRRQYWFDGKPVKEWLCDRSTDCRRMTIAKADSIARRTIMAHLVILGRSCANVVAERLSTGGGSVGRRIPCANCSRKRAIEAR
ncbi:unnamed protein product [Soboliphyme baturini]|uniref:Zf-TRM13_CCCH domain-containing protein n=1 Tax=Soboliphyme baturini TaxID=241478 RepID=A0A183IF93_9BILA|nr:unnamed protein product [Soboliphyme baturini]